MWFPAFRRDRRISSAKKTDSFMGSDLSFEDLTNRSLADYKYKLLNSNIDCKYNGTLYKDKCYELESKPEDLNTEYDKHITTVLNIEKDVYVAIYETSYDKNNPPKRLKEKSIIYNVYNDGEKVFYIMNTLIVENVQDDHTTELYVSKININNGFEAEMFGVMSLKRLP